MGAMTNDEIKLHHWYVTRAGDVRQVVEDDGTSIPCIDDRGKWHYRTLSRESRAGCLNDFLRPATPDEIRAAGGYVSKDPNMTTEERTYEIPPHLEGQEKVDWVKGCVPVGWYAMPAKSGVEAALVHDEPDCRYGEWQWTNCGVTVEEQPQALPSNGREWVKLSRGNNLDDLTGTITVRPIPKPKPKPRRELIGTVQGKDVFCTDDGVEVSCGTKWARHHAVRIARDIMYRHYDMVYGPLGVTYHAALTVEVAGTRIPLDEARDLARKVLAFYGEGE